MTTNNQATDDLAHKRFKDDFNKLFGAPPQMRKHGVTQERRRRNVEKFFPTDALRKEYAAAAEGGKILMILEKTLEEMVEPIRLERRALLAKIEAHSREIQSQIDAAKRAIAEAEAAFAEVKRRDEEARASLFKRRPYALDVNDPRVVELIGDAFRRNPGLFDKIGKPN